VKKIIPWLAGAVLAAVAAASCCRPADTETAVRQAIERYLATRPNLNMQGMSLEISRVQLRADEAEAGVTFRAKGDAKAIMSMHYTLKRQGGQWEVQPSATENPHGAAGGAELPAGHPPVASERK